MGVIVGFSQAYWYLKQ